MEYNPISRPVPQYAPISSIVTTVAISPDQLSAVRDLSTRRDRAPASRPLDEAFAARAKCPLENRPVLGFDRATVDGGPLLQSSDQSWSTLRNKSSPMCAIPHSCEQFIRIQTGWHQAGSRRSRNVPAQLDSASLATDGLRPSRTEFNL
jgi:hypothetical protein